LARYAVNNLQAERNIEILLIGIAHLNLQGEVAMVIRCINKLTGYLKTQVQRPALVQIMPQNQA